MCFTRWSVIVWLKSKKSTNGRDLGGRHVSCTWCKLPTQTLPGTTQAGVLSSQLLPLRPHPLPLRLALICYFHSQFHNTGPFSSTNIPLLLSTGPSIPKAPSPPWSCLFILQEYFWVFSLVKHVNTIVSRGVGPNMARATYTTLGLSRVLKTILCCQFKVQTDSRWPVVNDGKVKWRVELTSLEICKYWPLLESCI